MKMTNFEQRREEYLTKLKSDVDVFFDLIELVNDNTKLSLVVIHPKTEEELEVATVFYETVETLYNLKKLVKLGCAGFPADEDNQVYKCIDVLMKALDNNQDPQTVYREYSENLSPIENAKFVYDALIFSTESGGDKFIDYLLKKGLMYLPILKRAMKFNITYEEIVKDLPKTKESLEILKKLINNGRNYFNDMEHDGVSKK